MIPTRLMVAYNESIYFDPAFYSRDIAGSIAFARANPCAGIITQEEFETIEEEMDRVGNGVEMIRLPLIYGYIFGISLTRLRHSLSNCSMLSLSEQRRKLITWCQDILIYNVDRWFTPIDRHWVSLSVTIYIARPLESLDSEPRHGILYRHGAMAWAYQACQQEAPWLWGSCRKRIFCLNYT